MKEDEIIARQLDAFQHLQNQAQSLFRTLLAAIAVIVALSRSEIVLYLRDLSIPAVTVVTGDGALTYEGLFSSIAQANLLLVGVLTMMGVILIGDSLAWSGRVLRIENLGPSLGSHKGYKEANTPPYRSKTDIDRWIEINEERLSTAKHYLDQSYKRIIESGIPFSIAILLSVSMLLGRGNLMVLVDFLILLIIPGIAIDLGNDVRKRALRNPKGSYLATYKAAASGEVDEKLDEAPSWLALIFLLGLYSTAATIALTTVIAWTLLVWIPAIQ